MSTILKDGQTLLFIGDSITDCGRRDSKQDPLGWGYVKFFHDLRIAREPEKKVTILNRGIGGNTVDDLRSRWDDDMLQLEPDWLSIKIGINDINRHLTGNDKPVALDPKSFGEIYLSILERTKEALPKTEIVLISPFFLSKDKAPGSYRTRVVALLPEYIAQIEKLVKKFKTRYVPLNDIFRQHLKLRRMHELAPEPVHPNGTGHIIIAEAVYAALSKKK